MARKVAPTPQKKVDESTLARAFAAAVATGDLVNFRLLLSSFSPGRPDSLEALEDAKYAYLLPGEELERSPQFAGALDAVRQPEVWKHVLGELQARRPAQLPSSLVILLADNAVRAKKYTAAAQAYEMIRIRRRMQEEFLSQGDSALAQDEIARAVRAYLVAVGLDYDYAAFPEPLPRVPNFQKEALTIHGKPPTSAEDIVALQDEEAHCNSLLEFLLGSPEAATRLRTEPLTKRLRFLKELVNQGDPNWDEFAARFREACVKTEAIAERMRTTYSESGNGADTLKEEIEEQHNEDLDAIPAHLLGRAIEGGEWWQYVKEIAYEHPAGALFISRQRIGDHEIVIPRLRADSSVPATLGLTRPE